MIVGRRNPDLQIHPVPWFQGGCYVHKFQSISGTNATVISNKRAQLYGFTIFNNLNSEVRICFHNNSNPVAGVGIKISFVLNKQQPQIYSISVGIEFDLAISYTLVFGILDSGITGVTANNVVGSILWR